VASFSTFAACETRAVAKTADGTWIMAHAQRGFTGTLGVRVQRKMTSALTEGGWVEITDDATV
jgi:hypothetical protein